MIINSVSDLIYDNPSPLKPHSAQLAKGEPIKGGGSQDNVRTSSTLEERLAHGDLTNGKKIFGHCALCHTPIKNGPNRVGPPLFGVVNRKPADIKGYSYSKAMRAFGETGVKWDEATLDAYLRAPRSVVAGTAMSFAGVTNDQDRADLILYLSTLKDPFAPSQSH